MQSPFLSPLAIILDLPDLVSRLPPNSAVVHHMRRNLGKKRNADPVINIIPYERYQNVSTKSTNVLYQHERSHFITQCQSHNKLLLPSTTIFLKTREHNGSAGLSKEAVRPSWAVPAACRRMVVEKEHIQCRVSISINIYIYIGQCTYYRLLQYIIVLQYVYCMYI